MRRPERFVAVAFGLAVVAAFGLIVVYIRGGQPQLEGILLFVALGGIGAGLMAWAKGLMRGIEDQTQPRYHGPHTDEELDSVADAVEEGVGEIKRRRLLTGLLLSALGALGLAAIVPIRSLGRAPKGALARTAWTAGDRVVTVDGAPVTEQTLEIGSALTVFPEGHEGSADAQTVLVRVDPGLLQLEHPDWAVDGLVAYSKICTHAGCPLGLYLAATHELRCPCHQSTFNVLNGGKPVYGPAPKPLPQLPIDVGPDGVLFATADFDAPVGPSYWNMPGTTA